MSDKRKEVVRQGYDVVSQAYRADDGSGMPSNYAGWLAELTPLLPPGAPVLELGCGCGLPVAKRLADDFAYTGVDLSPVQIERAQALVPNGRFLTADMTTLDYQPGSFAAVLAFYAIIHLPLDEQRPLLANIFRWLQPGGCLMATVGYTAWTGTRENWLGAPMFWSHADAATYRQWLTEIGFSLHWDRFIPEGDSGHTLLLAQKPLTSKESP